MVVQATWNVFKQMKCKEGCFWIVKFENYCTDHKQVVLTKLVPKIALQFHFNSFMMEAFLL